MKKKGGFKMSPTAIVDLAAKRREKAMENYPAPKPIKRLTEEQMKSSENKRRRED
ncbi:hypothetical protein [Paenibacillus sp. LK1]|uniref:hypothetical protein n=1 Tax=Paenibacillus sp. LK1 TaxID=2053014 RepID=UPI0015D50D56|nr:hypothetical protein [Paenibacillus sp. LK1]